MPMTVTNDDFEEYDYIVTMVETETHIYEWLENDSKIQIKTKEINHVNKASDQDVFKIGNCSDIIYPKIKRSHKLFGLDDVEKNLLEILSDDDNSIICLYGPSGCGKFSLLQKLESDLDEIVFIWFDLYEFRAKENYLSDLFISMSCTNKEYLICINKGERYSISEMDSIKTTLENYHDLTVKIIISCFDKEISNADYSIFVPTLLDNEKLQFLSYLISNKTGEDVDVNGFASFVKLLKGYSARDIYNFVNMIFELYSDLSLDSLYRGMKEKLFVPRQLLGVISDIEPLQWTDIGGYEEVKRIMQTDIQKPILKGGKISKGIILYGPPGCSKTMFARALSTECQLHLFVVTPSKIMASLVGESEQRLRRIFVLAQAHAPSMVFIDEIDTLIPKRRGAESQVSSRLLQELLLFMDGVETKKDHKVIVMCATNMIERVDDALLRPGRMDLRIEIGLPDQASREAILKIIFSDQEYCVDTEVIESIPDIASKLSGRSGADIVNVGHMIKKLSRRQSNIGPKAILSMNHVTEIVKV